MSAGAIILLIAVMGVCVFEVVSLIATIVKKRKEAKKKLQARSDDCACDNKDGNVEINGCVDDNDLPKRIDKQNEEVSQ